MDPMGEPEPDSEWERLLSAERHLQALVPGTVLVGGTASALHARHRISLDGDHVLAEYATVSMRCLRAWRSPPGGGRIAFSDRF